ncbi:MAG TPA: hypothetical protein PLK12_16055 [Prolixibacteraceae bacterium]|nr:hypothetical protein [Prolixibacteraceae bacterium]
MKKILTISLLNVTTFLITQTTHAQYYTIKDRWNVKTNYSFYPNLGFVLPTSENFTPVGQVELNYGLFNFLEMALYSGCTQVTEMIITSANQGGGFGYGKIVPVLFYGATTNIHLFPFILKRENFRIDFYLSGKLGGFYI